MPRNGSDIFYILPGTDGIPDTTIESDKYNNYIHDVETDLNTPRPIVAGGTGANDADEALANLGAEKSSQLVTSYDTHVFYPGSFYSAAGATNAPVAGHAFVGIAVSSDVPASPPTNQNVVVRAYDQSSTVVPGRIYVREKKAGVWSVWSLDGTGVAGPTPPVDPPDNLLWWDSEGGHLYTYYNDGNSKQWVIASPFSDPAQFLLKAGDTMVGQLSLTLSPTTALHAVNKQYADTIANSAQTQLYGKVAKAGDTMTGALTAPNLHSVGTLSTAAGVNSVGRMITADESAGGFFANNTNFFGFNGDGTNRRFYFNTAAQWQYNTVSADLSWFANPYVMATFRYSDVAFVFYGSNAFKPGGGVWADTSDARIKNVEGDYQRGLAEVAQLHPVLYTYKGNDTPDAPAHIKTGVEADDANKAKEAVAVPYPNSPHQVSAKAGTKYAGLIAQEVEAILPEMVTKGNGYIDGAAVADLRTLDTTPLIFALINSIKELKARIEVLEGN